MRKSDVNEENIMTFRQALRRGIRYVSLGGDRPSFLDSPGARTTQRIIVALAIAVEISMQLSNHWPLKTFLFWTLINVAMLVLVVIPIHVSFWYWWARRHHP